MKTSKVPEKLYCCDKGNGNLFVDYRPFPNNESIEYTRTDTFIEKALKWYCLDCICNDTCSNTCYFKSTFKKYLEGDDKQLPPKIENAINPDGSTTENYRYRHFISRMQDAFIEKACDWLRKCLDNGLWVANDVGETEKEAIIEHFKKTIMFMKVEKTCDFCKHLTWEDIKLIWTIGDEIPYMPEEDFFKELLKRFKAQKGE